MVVESCDIATKKNGNAFFLDESIDGVSCQEMFNKNITFAYLLGKKKYLSLTNTDHNVKNCRGHMVSVTPSSSIVYFMIDTWMLKMANVAKYIYCIEGWASDAVVLRLTSPIIL